MLNSCVILCHTYAIHKLCSLHRRLKPSFALILVSSVTEMEAPLGSPHEAVLIDSLLSMEQSRGADSTSSADGSKPPKDIAEVASATELILPKGQAKTSCTVSALASNMYWGGGR